MCQTIKTMIVKAQGVVIGSIEGHTFKKTVYKSKHLFRKLNAYGIDAEYFTKVLLPENYNIEIYEKEEGITYNVSAQNFRKHCTFQHFKNKLTGKDYGAQVFLPINKWNIKLTKNEK